MPIEHPGGRPDVGFVKIESWTEQHYAVPITRFRPEDLDTLSDYIREAITTGQDIEPVIEQYLEAKAWAIRIDTFNWLVDYILEHKNPNKLELLYALAFVGRSESIRHMTGPAIARKLGVRKQAFNQCVSRLRKALKLRYGANIRTTEARAHMSQAYHARAKSKRPDARAGRQKLPTPPPGKESTRRAPGNR